MKLALMRHGHINRCYPDDFNIELTPKGIAEVKDVALSLTQALNIEKIIVSPSIRTQQTADIVSNIGNISNIETINDLYHVIDHDFLFSLIKNTLYNINNLLVIGHNPYINTLPLLLIQDNQDDYLLSNTIDYTARAVVMNCSNMIDYRQFTIDNIFLPN